jgi:hypothetical protein
MRRGQRAISQHWHERYPADLLPSNPAANLGVLLSPADAGKDESGLSRRVTDTRPPHGRQCKRRAGGGEGGGGSDGVQPQLLQKAAVAATCRFRAVSFCNVKEKALTPPMPGGAKSDFSDGCFSKFSPGCFQFTWLSSYLKQKAAEFEFAKKIFD